MKGAHRIVVYNRAIKYDFTIRRNITVVRGNSATGKTSLIEMIQEYAEEDDSGITVICDKKCAVLYGKNWENRLDEISDSIVFLDESSRFTGSDDFAERIRRTDNYYVIVSREKLSNLPYSIEEVYGIRESGRYLGMKQRYTQNEFYHLYGQKTEEEFSPDVIVTEDSNAGFDYFQAVCMDHQLACISAGGKTNVLNKTTS